MNGADLYYVRWWEARLKGIVLRSWDSLPASIKRIWKERANTVGADDEPTTEAPSRGRNET